MLNNREHVTPKKGTLLRADSLSPSHTILRVKTSLLVNAIMVPPGFLQIDTI